MVTTILMSVIARTPCGSLISEISMSPTAAGIAASPAARNSPRPR